MLFRSSRLVCPCRMLSSAHWFGRQVNLHLQPFPFECALGIPSSMSKMARANEWYHNNSGGTSLTHRLLLILDLGSPWPSCIKCAHMKAIEPFRCNGQLIQTRTKQTYGHMGTQIDQVAMPLANLQITDCKLIFKPLPSSPLTVP